MKITCPSIQIRTCVAAHQVHFPGIVYPVPPNIESTQTGRKQNNDEQLTRGFVSCE